MLERYAAAISGAPAVEIKADPSLGGELLLTKDGAVTVCYAPFEYINAGAKVVLVGITPGRQQTINALLEASRRLGSGDDIAQASRAAKEFASFSGAMRSNLIGLLDAIGLQEWLGIASCGALFRANADLVHHTSALRFPVYVDGKDYRGQPDMLTTPSLRRYVDECLALEAVALRNAVWIPLGPKPAAALSYLAQKTLLSASNILDGLPHPSGANAERISYFLGRKSRDRLSNKTNPDNLDSAKSVLISKVLGLRSR